MNNSTILTSLGITILILLSAFSAALNSKGLLNPTKAGFWCIVSMALYFVVYPLGVAVTGDYDAFNWYSGGAITADAANCVAIGLTVGISTMLLTYLRLSPTQSNLEKVAWNYKKITCSPDVSKFTFFILISFFLWGMSSIILYRTISIADKESIGMASTSGKFSGNVTGWQTEVQSFCIIPMLVMVTSKTFRLRALGFTMLGLYTSFRLLDHADRFSLILPFLALGIFTLISNGKKWPSIKTILVIAGLMCLLIARGHNDFKSFEISSLSDLLYDVVDKITVGADTAMVANYYRQSQIINDTGFTYGLSVAHIVFFEPLPRILFPWKDILGELTPGMNVFLNTSSIMAGGKSSIFCGFYHWFWYIGIFFGAIGLGWIFSFLDKLNRPENSRMSVLLGSLFLGTIWLGLAGNPEWWIKTTLTSLFPLAVATGINFLAKQFEKSR